MLIKASIENIINIELTEADVTYVRFGQIPPRPLDPTLPVPRGTDNIILTFHPDLPLRQVNIATGSLTIQYILDRFRTFHRHQQEGLLEWARLNVHSIEAFFEACIRNPLFSKKNRIIYEPMRMIAVRVLNRYPIEVPACEEFIQKHQRDAFRQANAKVLYLAGEVNALTIEKENAERDRDNLEELIHRGKARERVEGRGADQPIPQHRSTTELILQRLRESRAAERPGQELAVLPELELPPRDQDSADLWRDHDEDPKNGRAWCLRPASSTKPSSTSESRTVKMVE